MTRHHVGYKPIPYSRQPLMHSIAASMAAAGWHLVNDGDIRTPRRGPTGAEWRCPAPCARIHKRAVAACPMCEVTRP